MKMRIWLPLLLAVASLTSACTNTMRGAGQDIEHGGKVMQDKAS